MFLVSANKPVSLCTIDISRHLPAIAATTYAKIANGETVREKEKSNNSHYKVVVNHHPSLNILWIGVKKAINSQQTGQLVLRKQLIHNKQVNCIFPIAASTTMITAHIRF